MPEQTSRVTGRWIFSEKVPVEELVTVTKELQRSDSGYIQVIIHRTTKNRLALGYIYEFRSDAELSKKISVYIQSTWARLEEKFKTDLEGWDIGVVVWISAQAE